MVGEKKEDDIVGRLEALRKKVPPPTTEKVKAPAKPEPATSVEASDEKRRKLARIVGILVIVVILGAVFLVGYNFFIKKTGPADTVPPTTGTPDGQSTLEQQRLAELATAKAQAIGQIKDAYAGLPTEYNADRDMLISQVSSAKTKEAVADVDYVSNAEESWRDVQKKKVDALDATTSVVIAQVGDDLIKGMGDIKNRIDRLSLAELKAMTIREGRSEFIPIRLPRDQAAGGFADVGDRVNIHYVWTDANGTDKSKYLAKDGRVVAILKPATSISLSESEQQTQAGGGTEGKGNVTTITLGSSLITISDGPYGASVGYKELSKSSTYTVNLAEVQKAAAANKVSEEEFMENMEKYGARLTQIERDTNIADFAAEYMMLLEVSEDEAKDIVPTLFNSDARARILITFSDVPTWAG